MAGSRIDLDAIGFDLSDDDEYIRVFNGAEGGTYLIDAERIGEPFVLGMILVDLINHGSMAFAHAKGLDPTEAYQTIMNPASSSLAVLLEYPAAKSPDPVGSFQAKRKVRVTGALDPKNQAKSQAAKDEAGIAG